MCENGHETYEINSVAKWGKCRCDMVGWMHRIRRTK